MTPTTTEVKEAIPTLAQVRAQANKILEASAIGPNELLKLRGRALIVRVKRAQLVAGIVQRLDRQIELEAVAAQEAKDAEKEKSKKQ